MAEAVVFRFGKTRASVRAVRPEERRIRSGRRTVRTALLQPGEPQRLRARQHACGASGSLADSFARIRRIARAQWLAGIFARTQQVYSGSVDAAFGNCASS